MAAWARIPIRTRSRLSGPRSRGRSPYVHEKQRRCPTSGIMAPHLSHARRGSFPSCATPTPSGSASEGTLLGSPGPHLGSGLRSRAGCSPGPEAGPTRWAHHWRHGSQEGQRLVIVWAWRRAPREATQRRGTLGHGLGATLRAGVNGAGVFHVAGLGKRPGGALDHQPRLDALIPGLPDHDLQRKQTRVEACRGVGHAEPEERFHRGARLRLPALEPETPRLALLALLSGGFAVAHNAPGAPEPRLQGAPAETPPSATGALHLSRAFCKPAAPLRFSLPRGDRRPSGPTIASASPRHLGPDAPLRGRAPGPETC